MTTTLTLYGNQPRPSVICGKYESSFDPSEPEAYRRDVPGAQVYIMDGGHFALDTATDDVASLVRAFLEGGVSENLHGKEQSCPG